MGERRKHPRVTVTSADLRVTLAYRVMKVVDVSVGGMKIELRGAWPKVGELVDVTMHLPAGDVKVDAMVRHVATVKDDRAHIGLEFDDVDLIESVLGAWLRERLAASGGGS
jgi:hypothetical protein